MPARTALAVGFTLLTAWLGNADAQPADKILRNGKIATVDDRFTLAQALAIRGTRIVAVGRDADMEQLRGPATEVSKSSGWSAKTSPPDGENSV